MYTVSGVSRISNGRGRVKIRAGPGGKQLLSGSRSSRPFARASAMPCRVALYLSIPSERNGGTPVAKPKNGTPPGSSAKLPERSLTARRFQIPERSAFAVADRAALWASTPEVTASAAIPTTIEPMKPVRIWKLLLRRHTDTRTSTDVSARLLQRLRSGLLFQGWEGPPSAPSVSTGALPPVSLKILRTLRPSLNGAPVTVIVSPNFRVFLFQPRRNSADGLVVSATQFETLPFSSFTSK